jgi:hypothetical protein
VIRVEPYDASRTREWNDFVAVSKNGTFLFDRGYCEYHADRFGDASLLLYQKSRLVGLLPATVTESSGRRTLTSHAGLTYGCIVCDERMTVKTMLACFDALLGYLRDIGIDLLVYRPPPAIYHAVPADEDLYALFRHNARLTRRDLSSALRPSEHSQHAPLTKGRRHAIGRGRRAGVVVEEGGPFDAFMEIQAALLSRKYGVRPTHSAAEITGLARRFPTNIRLFQALQDGELLGGCIVYETPLVAHVQYVASTEPGQRAGALDVLFDELLTNRYRTKRWFDFGTSTTRAGRELNEGLVANKESWGARAILYDTYCVDVR